jgi:hypothetical protein
MELAPTQETASCWSECSAVESIPGKVSGAWVFKDTRMPVSLVFGNLEAGAKVDEIMGGSKTVPCLMQRRPQASKYS